VPIRYLLSPLVVLLAKIASAVLIYYLINIQTFGTFWSNPDRVFNWLQDQVLLGNIVGNTRWPLTFIGWDSAWYVSIMTNGYAISSQSYTFSPALPFIAYLSNFIIENPIVSIVIVSVTFGILLIPLYQILAEDYLSKKTAMLSTLLFAFMPYVFVFTTVAYSESLMLFFILAAWVFANKGRMLEASTFALVAPLTRTMGILVVIPLLFNALKSKSNRGRNILLSLLPILSLCAWFVYLGLITGVPLAPVSTTEWGQLWTVRTLISEGIPRYGMNAILEAPYQFPPIITHWLLPLAVLVALVLPLLLLPKLRHKDKALWLYAFAGYLGVLFFGAIVSIPRFMAVIFPFALILSTPLSGKKKSIIITVVLMVVFYFFSMNLWLSFLTGEFIA
jgi:hypothetical protein